MTKGITDGQSLLDVAIKGSLPPSNEFPLYFS